MIDRNQDIMMRVLLCFLCVTIPFSPSSEAQEQQPDQPNFIIIFTDDQGYQDVGVYGAKGFDTPNLDRMARQGLKMNSFYVAAAVCSPSRSALLTGSYPPRNNMQGLLVPDKYRGLHPDEVTIADLLKKQGYATSVIGKWHQGHNKPLLPMNQGFDQFYGLPYSNDMDHDPSLSLADSVNFRKGATRTSFKQGKKQGPPLMRNDEVVEFPAKQSTLTKRYTREAIRFIEDNQDQPFFLYLPHTMPHKPLAASEQFRGMTDRGLYGDVIREIDWSTGQILDTLKKLDLARETLVLFTSDNGPGKFGSAGPLSGGKTNAYEGGLRVPAIFWWPGQIPAGTESDEIVSTIDMLPTIAELTGAEMPSDRTIDGKNVTNILFEPDTAVTPHKYFVYSGWGHRVNAIRSGKWKLHLQTNKLYNLKQDISEQNNVVDDHPEVVKKLRSMASSHKSELRKNRRPAAQVPKSTFTLESGDYVGQQAAPLVRNRPFIIEAEISEPSENGVIVAQGGKDVGYTLYVKDGRLHFGIRQEGNYSEITSSEPLSGGSMTLRVELCANGDAVLQRDGKQLSTGTLSLLSRKPVGGLDAGLDRKGNVGPYSGKFEYGGTLKNVIIRFPDEPDQPYFDVGKGINKD